MMLKNFSRPMEVETNIQTLNLEVDWLESVIEQVIITYLMQEGHEMSWEDIPVPDLTENNTPYAVMVSEWGLGKYERLALALGLAPHIRPQVLDIFLGKNQLYDRPFTEFGGVTDKGHGGVLPTGQTFLFLLTGNDPLKRTEVLKILGSDSILVKEQVLVVHDTETYLPKLNGILGLSDRWFYYFQTGVRLAIENSPEFPAHRITTNMEWEDIVLDDHVKEQVNEINVWLKHGDALMNDWQLFKKIKPGYRALFYGPPGTGKTLTATLIGKSSGRDVYKIDLSMVVSKYIGETEKNLSRIFDTAQYRNWILFFDEADALFGKRTATESSNDRHANQQTAYLLQRIEDFPGIVILASNLRGNMDDAFTRRFQSVIYFGMPTPQERYQLWKNAFSGTCTLDPAIDIHRLAEEYELTGGSIINLLRHCAMSAINRNDTVVSREELMTGLRKEYKKENKTLRFAN
jgi:AAA+ superfamily predicted ATPase